MNYIMFEIIVLVKFTEIEMEYLFLDEIHNET
jgi:hypothetical protein